MSYVYAYIHSIGKAIKPGDGETDDRLYRRIGERRWHAGPVTPADLHAFIERLGWTRSRLGAELDISQDRLRRMLDGVSPIPRHIALACAALAHGLPPIGSALAIAAQTKE